MLATTKKNFDGFCDIVHTVPSSLCPQCAVDELSNFPIPVGKSVNLCRINSKRSTRVKQENVS